MREVEEQFTENDEFTPIRSRDIDILMRQMPLRLPRQVQDSEVEQGDVTVAETLYRRRQLIHRMELQVAEERSRLFQEINNLRAQQVRNDSDLREPDENTVIQRTPINENIGEHLRRREPSPSVQNIEFERHHQSE